MRNLGRRVPCVDKRRKLLRCGGYAQPILTAVPGAAAARSLTEGQGCGVQPEGRAEGQNEIGATGHSVITSNGWKTGPPGSSLQCPSMPKTPRICVASRTSRGAPSAITRPLSSRINRPQ